MPVIMRYRFLLVPICLSVPIGTDKPMGPKKRLTGIEVNFRFIPTLHGTIVCTALMSPKLYLENQINYSTMVTALSMGSA